MRKISIEIPDADERYDGVQIWEAGYELDISVEDGITIIRGNRAGLISLAKYCLILCQDEAKTGDHLHFDACDIAGGLGELDPGSTSLILAFKNGVEVSNPFSK